MADEPVQHVNSHGNEVLILAHVFAFWVGVRAGSGLGVRLRVCGYGLDSGLGLSRVRDRVRGMRFG